jgi:hypothetical protein
MQVTKKSIFVMAETLLANFLQGAASHDVKGGASPQ